MLIHLFKYEIKSIFRQLLPFYAALILFALLEKVFYMLQMPTIMSFTALFHILIIAAVMVFTLVVITRRFYSNFFSNEGYLTFTLPVKTWELITSKLIAALLFAFTGMLLTFATVFFLFITINPDILAGVQFPFSTITPDDMLNLTTHFAAFIYGTLMYDATAILIIYASVSIGHLSREHNIFCAFAAFFGLFIFSQIFSFILDANYYVTSLLLCGIFFIITNYILSHRLNLA